MIVNLWLLSISLLLLWFPRQWLRFGVKLKSSSRSRRSKRTASSAGAETPAQSYKQLLKPRNWVDFSRALAGGLAVSYLCFEEAPDAAKTVGLQIFLLQIAIFLIAVLIQTLRTGQGLALVAPVFFVLGLSFGLIGWKAALFVFVAGLFLSRLLPGPGIYLFVFALLEIGFGVLLRGASSRMILAAGALSMIPVVLSGVLKRPIVWLNKSQTKPM